MEAHGKVRFVLDTQNFGTFLKNIRIYMVYKIDLWKRAPTWMLNE